MVYYFDTSALVKRYAPNEANSQLVSAFFTNTHRIYTSALTQTEMISAFCIKERNKQFSKLELQTAIQDYKAHSPANYILIQPSNLTHNIAENLILTHPLRAYDALHVATAIEIIQQANIKPQDLEFHTADKDQAAAAKAEGLTVILL